MGYESLTQTFIVGDQTYLYIGLAILTVLFGIVFLVLSLTKSKKKADIQVKELEAHLFYLENVIAFKVGYIHKTAKDKDIELVFRPKSDLMTALEEEVSSDLNTTS